MSSKYLLPLLFLATGISSFARKTESREYYQITVYHFKDALQETAIDEYLNLADMYYNLADLDNVRKTINEGLKLANTSNASRLWFSKKRSERFYSKYGRL